MRTTRLFLATLFSLALPFAAVAQSWTAATSYGLPGSLTVAQGLSAQVAIGDLNSDGLGDVAILANGQAVLLAGDGKGGLAPLAAKGLPAVVSSFAVGDVNGDGLADMIVVGKMTASSPEQMLVLLNQGSGASGIQFAAPGVISNTNLPALDANCRVAAGNFAAHQATAGVAPEDIALNCNASPNSIFIASNDGTGTFPTVTAIAGVEQGRTITSIQAAGINADGSENLTILSIDPNAPGGAPRIDLLQNASGVFSAEKNIVPAAQANTFADYDGDGILDVLDAAGSLLQAQRGQAVSPGQPPAFAAAQTVNTFTGCTVAAVAAGNLQNSAGSAALDLVAATLCPAPAPATGYALSFVPLLNQSGTSLTLTQTALTDSDASYQATVAALLGSGTPTGNVSLFLNNQFYEALPLSNGAADFTLGIPDQDEMLEAAYQGSDQFAASSAQTIVSGSGSGTSSGSGSGGTSSGSGAGTGTVADPSATIAGTGTPGGAVAAATIGQTPSISEIATNSNPINYGNSVTLRAMVDTAGAAPTGTVSFRDEGDTLGTATVAPLSTTNQLIYSSGFETAGWANVRASVIPSAASAPDGSNTAEKLVESTSNDNHVLVQNFSTTAAAQVTISIYAKAAERSAMFLVMYPNPWTNSQVGAFFDLAQGTVGTHVTSGNGILSNASITPVGNGWYRCSVSGTVDSSATSLNFEPDTSLGTIPGSNYYTGDGASGIYIWGAQAEVAPALGPYVATGSTTRTGSGGVASFETSALSMGTHSITAAYSGDANFAPSTSSPIAQVVGMAPTVTNLSTSPNPSDYGQNVTLSALVNTGGGTPAGTVNFVDGNTSIGSAAVTPATTTNLVPQTSKIGTGLWYNYWGPLNNYTANATDVAAPDGTYTSTKFVMGAQMLSSGASPSSWGAIISGASGAVKTPDQVYTASVWIKGANGGEIVNVGIDDNNTQSFTLSTSWVRYSVTSPAFVSGNQDSRIFEFYSVTPNAVFYVWSPQVEAASSVGPFVATNGTPLTGSGGIATFSASGLTPGAHSVTATYSGDSNYTGSASPAYVQTVNQVPVSISCSPSSIVYGAALSAASMNCSSNGVEGSFSYSPALGTVLGGGNQTITVGFTPADSATYTTPANISPTIVVAKAAPSITVSCSPNPLTYGSQTASCTAAVAAVPGGATPGGTATWTINGNAWTIAPLSSGSSNEGGFNNYAPGSYIVAVSYGGDSNYTTVSGSTSLSISKQNPDLTVSCTPNSIAYPGAAVSCTLAATSTAGGSGPTGLITWTINGSNWTTRNLSGGAATVSGGFSGYYPGAYTIGASYAGDANYNGGAVSTLLSITKADQTIHVTMPAPANAPYTSSFTVSASSSASLPVNYAAAGGCTNSGATFTMTSSSIPCTVKFDQAGNVKYNPATEVIETVAALPAPATVAVTSDMNPVEFARYVAFTATISNGAAATGTVTFEANGTAFGTAPVTNGVAVYTGTNENWAPGTYAVTALYSGDANYSPASGSMSQSVVQAKAMIAVSAGVVDVRFVNDSCSDCLGVSIGGGDRNLYIDSVTVGSTTIPGSDPSLTFTGSTSNTAGYLGSSGDMLVPNSLVAGASSLTVSAHGQQDYSVWPTMQVIANGNIVQTVTVDSGSAQSYTIPLSPEITAGFPYGQPVPLMASLVGHSGGTPTGTVKFYDGSTLLGTATLNDGIALFYANNLALGAHTITAQYSGDANFYNNPSNSFPVTVGQTKSISEIAASSNPINYGNSVTLSARVDTGGAAPTGSVTFEDGAVSLGTATLSSVTTTNLVSYSSALESSSWSKNGATVTPSATTAPDGSGSGEKLVESADGNNHAVSNTFSIPAGAVATASIYAKAGERSALFLALDSGTGDLAGQYFDLAHGTLGTSSQQGGAVLSNASITPVGNGWYRCSITGALNSSSTEIALESNISTGTADTSNSYTGDGRSGIYLWGAQAEAAPALGPYVATGAAAQTGSGGVASLTVPSLAMGSHAITADYQGDTNVAASVSGTLTEAVNTIGLTITASSASVNYGAPVPTITPSYLGFTDGDTASALTAPPVCTTTYTPDSPVGTYPTTCSGASDVNYAISYVSGTVTVSQAPQTITYAEPQSLFVYGAAPISLNATASSNLPVSFSATGPCSVTGSRVALTGVGTCTIQAMQGGDTNYLAAEPVSHDIVIGQATPASSLSASGTLIARSKPVTLTMALSASGSGVLPTGTVTFTLTPAGSGTLQSATIPVGATGVAAWTATPAVGTYTVSAVYSGDGNYTAATATTANITVTAAANFTATAATPDLTLTAPGSATDTIDINPMNLFFGPVAMRCTGLPAGASCAFAPATVIVPTPRGLLAQPSVATTMTITTTAATPAGTYPVTVTGTSGTHTSSTEVLLTVTQ